MQLLIIMDMQLLIIMDMQLRPIMAEAILERSALFDETGQALSSKSALLETNLLESLHCQTQHRLLLRLLLHASEVQAQPVIVVQALLPLLLPALLLPLLPVLCAGRLIITTLGVVGALGVVACRRHEANEDVVCVVRSRAIVIVAQGPLVRGGIVLGECVILCRLDAVQVLKKAIRFNRRGSGRVGLLKLRHEIWPLQEPDRRRRWHASPCMRRWCGRGTVCCGGRTW